MKTSSLHRLPRRMHSSTGMAWRLLISRGAPALKQCHIRGVSSLMGTCGCHSAEVMQNCTGGTSSGRLGMCSCHSAERLSVHTCHKLQQQHGLRLLGSQDAVQHLNISQHQAEQAE